MKYRKCDVESKKLCSQGGALSGHVEVQGKQSKNSQKNSCFAMRFGHATTPRQIGVTSRSRARSCSPDSVECAKIRKKSRNLTYLVILLVYMRRHLAKMSGFPSFFVHTTTPRLFGATSQTTAQNTSPDSVECAKIGLAPRSLKYLAVRLTSVRKITLFR